MGLVLLFIALSKAKHGTDLADDVQRGMYAAYAAGYTDAMVGERPRFLLTPEDGADWYSVNAEMQRWSNAAWRSCRISRCVARPDEPKP